MNDGDLMGYQWDTWRFHGIFMGYIPVRVIKPRKLENPRTMSAIVDDIAMSPPQADIGMLA